MVYRRRKLINRVRTLVDEMLHLWGPASTGVCDLDHPRAVQVSRLEERALMSASPIAMVADAVTAVADSADTSISADATLNGDSDNQTSETFVSASP